MRKSPFSNKKVVVINDTLACALGGMAEHGGRDFRGYLGFILGTGSNMCYFEELGHIPRINRANGRRMAVNLESGGYGGFRQGNSSIRVGNGGAKVYEYLMAHEFPYFGGTSMYHTGDLAFWFYSLGNVRYQIAGAEEDAYKAADFCSTVLANFCRTGDPSVGNIQWLPHEEDNAHCMIVDVDSRLVKGNYGEKLIDLMTMVNKT